MIIRHDIDPKLYLAESDQFSAVVAIATTQEEILTPYDNIDKLLKPSLITATQSETEYYTCCNGMGSLISPNWILTAAHVAKELSPNAKIKIKEKAFAIKEIFSHPYFLSSGERELAENDIALIQLQQAVEGVQLLPLYQQKDELGKVVTLVGQGDFGNGLTGPECVDSKMRIATNRIEQADDQHLVFTFDAPPNCTKLEGVSGPGDNGGPALIKIDEGWAIAGISSSQQSLNAREGHYGVIDYYTRISFHLDWINFILQGVQ